MVSILCNFSSVRINTERNNAHNDDPAPWKTTNLFWSLKFQIQIFKSKYIYILIYYILLYEYYTTKKWTLLHFYGQIIHFVNVPYKYISTGRNHPRNHQLIMFLSDRRCQCLFVLVFLFPMALRLGQGIIKFMIFLSFYVLRGFSSKS